MHIQARPSIDNLHFFFNFFFFLIVHRLGSVCLSWSVCLSACQHASQLDPRQQNTRHNHTFNSTPAHAMPYHATHATAQAQAHLEVYPCRADHRRRELVLRETRHEARLAHAGVAQQQDANGVVEVVSLLGGGGGGRTLPGEEKRRRKKRFVRHKVNTMGRIQGRGQI